MTWQDKAACKGLDPELFFPPRGVNATEAKAVCASCPVQTDCALYALEHNEREGIWGGLAREERLAFKRLLGWTRSRARLAHRDRRRNRVGVFTMLEGREHGRRGTYVDGCRCDPCTDADTRYQQTRRKRSAA